MAKRLASVAFAPKADAVEKRQYETQEDNALQAGILGGGVRAPTVEPSSVDHALNVDDFDVENGLRLAANSATRPRQEPTLDEAEDLVKAELWAERDAVITEAFLARLHAATPGRLVLVDGGVNRLFAAGNESAGARVKNLRIGDLALCAKALQIYVALDLLPVLEAVIEGRLYEMRHALPQLCPRYQNWAVRKGTSKDGSQRRSKVFYKGAAVGDACCERLIYSSWKADIMSLKRLREMVGVASLDILQKTVDGVKAHAAAILANTDQRLGGGEPRRLFNMIRADLAREGVPTEVSVVEAEAGAAVAAAEATVADASGAAAPDTSAAGIASMEDTESMTDFSDLLDPETNFILRDDEWRQGTRHDDITVTLSFPDPLEGREPPHTPRGPAPPQEGPARPGPRAFLSALTSADEWTQQDSVDDPVNEALVMWEQPCRQDMDLHSLLCFEPDA